MARGRISDSALKSCSYLLTVCRCQRTSQGLVSGPAVGLISGNLFPSLKLKTVVFAFSFPLRGWDRWESCESWEIFSPSLAMVGVTGLEPVTLRLSSACSNQLSYTPVGWPWGFWFGIRRPRLRPASAGQWRHGDSNPRPIACKATALPTELCPLGVRDSASPGLSHAAGSLRDLKSKN